MTLKTEILGQKFAHFGQFEGSFLAILGVKKVDFWTFSKLFWTITLDSLQLFDFAFVLLQVVGIFFGHLYPANQSELFSLLKPLYSWPTCKFALCSA